MIKNTRAIIATITMLSITHMTYPMQNTDSKKLEETYSIQISYDANKKLEQQIADKKAFKCAEMLARNRKKDLKNGEKQAHRVCEEYLGLWAQQYKDGSFK